MSSRDPKKQNQKDDTRTGGNVQTKGASKRKDDAPTTRTGGNVQTKGASKRSPGRKK